MQAPIVVSNVTQLQRLLRSFNLQSFHIDEQGTMRVCDRNDETVYEISERVWRAVGSPLGGYPN